MTSFFPLHYVFLNPHHPFNATSISRKLSIFSTNPGYGYWIIFSVGMTVDVKMFVIPAILPDSGGLESTLTLPCHLIKAVSYSSIVC